MNVYLKEQWDKRRRRGSGIHDRGHGRGFKENTTEEEERKDQSIQGKGADRGTSGKVWGAVLKETKEDAAVTFNWCFKEHDLNKHVVVAKGKKKNKC